MAQHQLSRQFVRMVAHLTGNPPGQQLLERLAQGVQILQGIGFGATVASSGEASILKRFRTGDSSHKLRIFDVGANKGEFIHIVLDALQARPLELHAFEPSSCGYNELARRFPTGSGVILNNCALGSAEGVGTLFYDTPGSGLASLTKRNLDHFGRSMNESEPVALKTLDDYCRARAITRIDLLKIDVEGHELDVLKGAAALFDADAVSTVMLEVGGCNIDTRTFVRDIFYFLNFYGMTVARVTPSGYWHECPDYKELYEQFRTTNFVAYIKRPRLK